MPVAEEIQEQVLSVVRKGNEITLEAIKAAVEAASALSIPGAIPAPKLPGTVSKLPAPSEVVDSAFGFAQKLLDEQHKFASEAVKAAAVLRAGTADRPGTEPAED